MVALAKYYKRQICLAFPLQLISTKIKDFKTTVGGLYSVILYLIMGYILVYLSIRIFKGKTTEIIETVSESTDYANIQPVYPFDNTKFIMGYTYAIDAIDYNCVQENIISQLYQYKLSKDENGLNPNRKYEYYDFEKCNNTHFSDKDFEKFPYLNYLD